MFHFGLNIRVLDIICISHREGVGLHRDSMHEVYEGKQLYLLLLESKERMDREIKSITDRMVPDMLI